MSKKTILNNMEEEFGKVEPMKTTKTTRASLNAQSARITAMIGESIPGIEPSKTLTNNTNDEIYMQLNKSYTGLKDIHKKFDKAYLLAPTNNSERKKKYDTLQRLQNDFNNEYEIIQHYTGNDKTIHELIAKIKRMHNDIALKTKIIKVNLSKSVPDPELLLPEQNSTPSASAATPAPIPAPPPRPPIATPLLPRPSAGAPRPPSVPTVSANLQKQNTRKKGNINALNRGTLESLYPNMSTLGEQPAPVQVQQLQKPKNNLSGNALQTLRNIERGTGVTNQLPTALPNSGQSNENLFNNMYKTANNLEKTVSRKQNTPQQSVQYIKLANGTIYKFIEIIGDTVRAQKLDRSTKTWEPIVELTEEDLSNSTEVRCPFSPQAGGRRTRRHRRQRKQRKQRKTRRA